MALAENFGNREKTELIKSNIVFGTHSDQRSQLVSLVVLVTSSSNQAAKYFTSEVLQVLLAPMSLT
jgi:hypothetical protein